MLPPAERGPESFINGPYATTIGKFVEISTEICKKSANRWKLVLELGSKINCAELS